MDTNFEQVVAKRRAEVNVIINRHGFEVEDANGDYISASHKSNTPDEAKAKALDLRQALSTCKGIEFDFSAEDSESFVDIYLRA